MAWRPWSIRPCGSWGTGTAFFVCAAPSELLGSKAAGSWALLGSGAAAAAAMAVVRVQAGAASFPALELMLPGPRCVSPFPLIVGR
jgi:hypothetical protein